MAHQLQLEHFSISLIVLVYTSVQGQLLLIVISWPLLFRFKVMTMFVVSVNGILLLSDM